jgi:hypothetical protein
MLLAKLVENLSVGGLFSADEDYDIVALGEGAQA